MRLNLGCGDDVRPGYTNVDIRKTHPSVVEVDLSLFPWPFEDESVDEILMLDFLEHFPYAQTERILVECYRILKPTGEVVIQVPDGEHLMLALAQRGDYLCNACGGHMQNAEPRQLDSCPKCGQSADGISEAAMRRLYGGQDYPGNFHLTAFTRRSLLIKADSCGLINPKDEETEHQYKNWNFKIRLFRGDPW